MPVAPVLAPIAEAIGIGGGEVAAGGLAAGGEAAAGGSGIGGMLSKAAPLLKKGAIFGTGSHIAQGILGGAGDQAAAGPATTPAGNVGEASSVLNPNQFQ